MAGDEDQDMLDVHSDEASGDEIMPDVDQEELPVSDVGADGVAGLTAQHSLEKRFERWDQSVCTKMSGDSVLLMRLRNRPDLLSKIVGSVPGHTSYFMTQGSAEEEVTNQWLSAPLDGSVAGAVGHTAHKLLEDGTIVPSALAYQQLLHDVESLPDFEVLASLDDRFKSSLKGELEATLSEAANNSSGKGKSKLGQLNTDAVNEDIVTVLTEYFKDINYLKFGDVPAYPADTQDAESDGSEEIGERAE